jgi:hypothetical protein
VCCGGWKGVKESRIQAIKAKWGCLGLGGEFILQVSDYSADTKIIALIDKYR